MAAGAKGADTDLGRCAIMRIAVAIAVLFLAGCENRADRNEAAAPPTASPTLTSGEERHRIERPGEAAATFRSGAKVPVSLPPGFTLYPGAEVVSNTRVERGGVQRVLVVFKTPDPLDKVMLFHRGQAEAAGVGLTVDLAGKDRASLAGHGIRGVAFALTAQRQGGGTRAELSFGPAS